MNKDDSGTIDKVRARKIAVANLNNLIYSACPDTGIVTIAINSNPVPLKNTMRSLEIIGMKGNGSRIPISLRPVESDDDYTMQCGVPPSGGVSIAIELSKSGIEKLVKAGVKSPVLQAVAEKGHSHIQSSGRV